MLVFGCLLCEYRDAGFVIDEEGLQVVGVSRERREDGILVCPVGNIVHWGKL